MKESTQGEKVFWVLLAPLVLAWTGYHFWRLVTTGQMPVHEYGLLVDRNSGVSFWVTLGLYSLLFIAALVVLASCGRWVLRKLR